MRLIVLLLTLMLAGCDATGPLSQSTGQLVDRIYLDAARTDPLRTDVALTQGARYRVEVRGTYSVWAPYRWGNVCVGTAEPMPVYPSVHHNGPVGFDAAYAFAGPTGTVICDRGSPSKRSGWLYKLGKDEEWALGPTDLAYRDDHTYSFEVKGQGESLGVRIRETSDFSDNYGQLRVSLYLLLDE